MNELRVIQMDRESSHEEDENDHDGKEAASTPTYPHKRPRSSPTCLTPRQCQKRVPLRELAANSTQCLEPRRLSYQSDSSHPAKEKWTPNETSALIEFILFHTTGDRWPTHKQMVFWKYAGEYVQTRSASNNYRSGMSKHVNNLIAYYMQEMLVGTKLDNV